MKDTEFVPASCKGDKALFQGHVMVTPMTVTEYWMLINDSQFKTTAEGEVSKDISNLGAIVKLLDACKHRVKSVDITRKSDKKRFTSYDALNEDIDCAQILIELGTFFISGGKVSKN